MKATVPWLGALLVAAAAASTTWAAGPCCPWPMTPDPRYPYIPRAPDLCGPGWYCSNPCGMVYGPNYCIYPPFPPFNGLLPGPKPPPQQRIAVVQLPGQPPQYVQVQCPCPEEPGPPVFPTHPFARSPRDFFMAD